MHEWQSWVVPAAVIVLLALPVWKWGERIVLLERDCIQHRKEIELHTISLQTLDARLDKQDGTLGRVETKLDMLLEAFKDVIHFPFQPRP